MLSNWLDIIRKHIWSKPQYQ